MEEYIFERVTAKHHPLLIDLYKDAFGTRLNQFEIQNHLDSALLEQPYIGYIAIHKPTNVAAAHYGVLPMKLVLNNTIFYGGQGMDAMTHSKHRLKGLFVHLGKLAFTECQREGIKIFFVFPNKNSTYGAINKLNCLPIDQIQRLDLKLKFKTFPFQRTLGRFRFFKKAHITFAKYILRNKIIPTPASFHNNCPNNYTRVFRDNKYIKFKESSDKFFINIDNQKLWIKLTDVLLIGDFSNYETNNNSFVKKLTRLAFLLGYNTISFHINESIKLPSFLSNFKKYNTAPSLVYYLNDTIQPKNILYTAADFDTW